MDAFLNEQNQPDEPAVLEGFVEEFPDVMEAFLDLPPLPPGNYDLPKS